MQMKKMMQKKLLKGDSKVGIERFGMDWHDCRKETCGWGVPSPRRLGDDHVLV